MKKTNMLFFVLATFCMCLVVSCGGDDGDADSETKGAEKVIDTTPITMYAGDKHTIIGADTITSSNQFVALSSKNVVKAWHVGQATLLVNGKSTIPVTVLPKYNLYDGPICNWGCDINYIRNNQKQGSREEQTNNGKYIIAYTNAGAASLLAYTFENNELIGVAALVSTNHVNQYMEFLSERYYMLPEYKGKNYYFIGADDIDVNIASTGLYTEVYNVDYLITLYVPMDKLRESTRSDNANGLIEEANELIKVFQID